MRVIMAWLLALLAFAGAPALAELPARPNGPILDQAGIIAAPEMQALDQRLQAYTKATGRSIIVATVSNLDGLPVEDYAQKLAEAWDIGGATTEEGVLLLVAPNERQIRIHTGRGVQDRLTDALSGRIIRDTMSPRFKQGDFGGGIAAGVDQIIAQLDRSPADAKAVAEAAEAAKANQQPESEGVGSVIFWILLIVVFSWLFSGRRRGRRSGIHPAVVLWGASEVGRHMGGWGGSSGGGFGGGGFGGFGGGGGGFDGGGASGSW